MILIFLVVVALFVQIVVVGADSCASLNSCVDCTTYGKGKSQCSWNAENNICQVLEIKNNHNVRYDDRCITERHPSVDDLDFLGNWMGELSGAGIYDRFTLLDLSLPGTHDTLTYDLSTRVSDGGADDEIRFAELMHKYAKIVPDDIGDFIRQNAQTQGLNITMQLNSGIRFLDLRTMYEYSDKVNPDWYSLHFLQSNKKMLTYFTEIREWMNSHPKEIVVMWLSKHGSECRTGEDQYPNVSIDIKQSFWGKVEDIFNGLLLTGNDSSIPPVRVNETSIQEMIERNARAIFYVSDYKEMTNSSIQVLDGCLIDNHLGPSVDAEQSAVEWEQDVYVRATMTKFENKKEQKFMLVSLATGVPSIQTVAQGDIRFLHHNDPNVDTFDEKIAIAKCTSAFHIPEFTSWCPPTLLHIASLENYYKQITLNQVYDYKELGWSYPNAIYINGVDESGTIRTGTQVMWADGSIDNNNEHATTKYAYVDTIIAFNLYLSCNSDVVHDQNSPQAQQCASLQTILDERRAKYPVQTWEDKVHGRLQNWPNIPKRDL
jgi:hypothetical protein